jgi:hypothetical protein
VLNSTGIGLAAEAAWELLRDLAPALRLEAGWRRPIATAIGNGVRPAVCRVVTYGWMIDDRGAGRPAARAGSPPGSALEVRCLTQRRGRRRGLPAGAHPAGSLRWRVTDVPLQQMCIVGDALLIFEDQRGRVVSCTASPAISLLAGTFDTLWDRAGTLHDEGPPEDLKEVLAQLASGATDRLAQRNANLSPRTFSRKVAELLHLLGASSRFQAGAEAAYRGWIRPS